MDDAICRNSGESLSALWIARYPDSGKECKRVSMESLGVLRTTSSTEEAQPRFNWLRFDGPPSSLLT